MFLQTQCQPIFITPTQTVKRATQAISEPQNDIQEYAKTKVLATFGSDQWESFYWIVNKESGWKPNAQNKTSTAYGLGQFLQSTQEHYGLTRNSSAEEQVIATIQYIKDRYQTPSEAQAFHQLKGWY